jgi:hypothetical protein
MAQRIEQGPRHVTISCLVSDLMFRWQLSDAGAGTDIGVEVEVPEREADRVPEQRRLLTSSLGDAGTAGRPGIDAEPVGGRAFSRCSRRHP